MHSLSIFCLLLFLFSYSASTAFSQTQIRYYLEGDGVLWIKNNKSGLGGRFEYRTKKGDYPLKAQNEINRVFGISSSETYTPAISLRLIALLDYLQDELKGGQILITSGYRSPSYNAGIRKKGRLAARTSLHLEGMAADLEMKDIQGKTLWEAVRNLHCCGAGYYHGSGIHLDTGPDRFWDETSTKVEQDLGAHNKLILLRTDRDIYSPGETIHLSLHRITDYPIGIQEQLSVIQLEKILNKSMWTGAMAGCNLLKDRSQTQNIEWKIPDKMDRSEKVQIRLNLCEKGFAEMPDEILSNPFSIR